ncbi:MAG: YqcC family protein [Gammaproteobacteria bacterium]|nr:YqcC family protein [Gammaproteobacteria bacterium]MDP6165947.1 YqcC family protein [Gammaproteobacteria bacterium]
MASEQAAKLLRELGVLQREMQNVGLWSDVSPTEEAMMSSQPFCSDAMSFTSWLQWIFVPRMLYMIESGGQLPRKSAMHPMAIAALSDMLDQGKGVMDSVKRLDMLLST